MLFGTLYTDIGVPMMAVHMFLLYYSVLSAITPPVAVAAYAVSSIAEDNPLLIAALAVKFAIAAFIVPFAFVYATELLMFGAWYSILFALATAAAGVVIIAPAVEGYFREALPGYSRLPVDAGGICLIAHDWNATIAGIVLSATGIGVAHLWPVEQKAR